MTTLIGIMAWTFAMLMLVNFVRNSKSADAAYMEYLRHQRNAIRHFKENSHGEV